MVGVEFEKVACLCGCRLSIIDLLRPVLSVLEALMFSLPKVGVVENLASKPYKSWPVGYNFGFNSAFLVFPF